MDAAIKQRAKGRLLTLISKIDELKQLGYEDIDFNNLLPSSLEGFEQELLAAYSELEAL